MQGREGSTALPAIYTLTRTPTHAKIIPLGVLNNTETDLFHGLIPQPIIFGMVRTRECETIHITVVWEEILSTLSYFACKTFA